MTRSFWPAGEAAQADYEQLRSLALAGVPALGLSGDDGFFIEQRFSGCDGESACRFRGVMAADAILFQDRRDVPFEIGLSERRDGQEQ